MMFDKQNMEWISSMADDVAESYFKNNAEVRTPEQWFKLGFKYGARGVCCGISGLITGRFEKPDIGEDDGRA